MIGTPGSINYSRHVNMLQCREPRRDSRESPSGLPGLRYRQSGDWNIATLPLCIIGIPLGFLRRLHWMEGTAMREQLKRHQFARGLRLDRPGRDVQPPTRIFDTPMRAEMGGDFLRGPPGPPRSIGGPVGSGRPSEAWCYPSEETCILPLSHGATDRIKRPPLPGRERAQSPHCREIGGRQ